MATVAATLFAVPVVVPPAGEYVADGAARQAAWALSGDAAPPEWSTLRAGSTREYASAVVPDIRSRYATAREALFGA